MIIPSFYTSQASTDQPLCFKSFIMASYQSVINLNIIMKFLIEHKDFVSLCTTVPYILFDHTRTWRTSPDEWSAQCRGHIRDNTNMKDDTHQAHTQSSQQGEYGMTITTAKWYSGTLGGLKFPDICLTGEEKPRKKTSPGSLSRPGIEPGPAAWQARMLPLAPQRWTQF